MRVLVIGASGQLGRALSADFRKEYEVLETGHRHLAPGQIALDLGRPEAAVAALETIKPALIVLAGAFCNVDGCEQQPDLCRRVNVDGVAAVAEYAALTGARVVFYSTDHVFDGEGESYREADPVNPLNVYARSKAEGEAIVRGTVPARHLIIRTAWLYGPDAGRRNFVLRLVDRLRSGERVAVPADQWGSPTYTEDVAAATRFLVERNAAGTYHATGPELLDRVSLARQVCARFGLDDRQVVPTPTKALRQAARRPLRARLDCGKLMEAGVPAFRTVNEGLEALRACDSARR